MIKAAIVFGVGYVFGARAGHERYGQIKEVAQQGAARLDEWNRTKQGSRAPSR